MARETRRDGLIGADIFFDISIHWRKKGGFSILPRRRSASLVPKIVKLERDRLNLEWEEFKTQ